MIVLYIYAAGIPIALILMMAGERIRGHSWSDIDITFWMIGLGMAILWPFILIGLGIKGIWHLICSLEEK